MLSTRDERVYSAFGYGVGIRRNQACCYTVNKQSWI